MNRIRILRPSAHLGFSATGIFFVYFRVFILVSFVFDFFSAPSATKKSPAIRPAKSQPCISIAQNAAPPIGSDEPTILPLSMNRPLW